MTYSAKSRCIIPGLSPVFLACLFGAAASADVVVVSNETGARVSCSLDSDRGPHRVTIEQGDCRPIEVAGEIQLALPDPKVLGRTLASFKLRPNAAYRLSKLNGEIEINRIELGGNEFTLKPGKVGPANEKVIVPISIWADDEQPLIEDRWVAKFRERVLQASAVVQRYSNVRFQVTRFGQWESKDTTRDFRHALLEFIDEVDPEGTLAIGFTSQHADAGPQGRPRLGGIRHPLDRHLLLSEASKSMIETERVEVLAHELGHFLGAAHSTDEMSVMRPQLGDGLARRQGFQLRFDPANTLLMSLIGEELRTNPISNVQRLSDSTRARLRQIYAVLATAAPDDPLPAKYLRLLR